MALAAGVYKDGSTARPFTGYGFTEEDGRISVDRYQVFDDGSIIALSGETPFTKADYNRIPNVTGDDLEFLRSNARAGGIQDLKNETVLRADLDNLPEPGGGRQTAALLQQHPGLGAKRLGPYTDDQGLVDLVVVRDAGFSTEELLQDGFTQEQIDTADTLRRQRDSGELSVNTDIRESVDQALAGRDRERTRLNRRIDEAGGLVQALFSDNPNERITRQQARDAGYSDAVIDAAIESNSRYFRDVDERARAVKENAAQQRALDDLAEYAEGDSYRIDLAVTDGVTDASLEAAGFSREQIATARQQAEGTPTGAGGPAEQQDQDYADFESRLAGFEGDEPGTYQLGLALASGAITEDQARAYASDPEEVVRQAQVYRDAAKGGYYADGSLVPDSLREVLLLRSAELSQELGEQRDLADRQEVRRQNITYTRANARANALEQDIADIDGFLADGGLLPDIGVSKLAGDVAGTERRIAELRNELDVLGAPDQRLEDQLDSNERLLERQQRDLEEAVRRAETQPITGLRNDPKGETLLAYAKAYPDQVVSRAIEEAALFAAGTVVTSIALRGISAAARAAGRAVSGAARDVAPLIRSEAGFIDLTAIKSRLSPRVIAQIDEAVAIVERPSLQLSGRVPGSPSTGAARAGSISPETRAAHMSEAARKLHSLRESIRADLAARNTSAEQIDETVRAAGLSDDQIAAWLGSLGGVVSIEAGQPVRVDTAQTIARLEAQSFVEAPTEPATLPDTADPEDPEGVPSPVRPVRIPSEEPPEPESPDVPSPVEPVVVPSEPETDPNREPETPPFIVPVPFEPVVLPTPDVGEPDIEVEGEPTPDQDEDTQTYQDTQDDTQTDADESIEDQVKSDLLDAQGAGSGGTGTTTSQAQDDGEGDQGTSFEEQIRQDLDPNNDDTSFEEMIRNDLDPENERTNDIYRIFDIRQDIEAAQDQEQSIDDGFDGGSDDGLRDRPPYDPPRRPLARRGPLPKGGRTPKKPARAAAQRLNPEWVGHKQGFVYRYVNQVTGDEVYSLTPLTGKVPKVTGKGSAKKSQRTITRTTKRTKAPVDHMGAFDVIYGKGGRIVNFRRSRKIRGRRG